MVAIVTIPADAKTGFALHGADTLQASLVDLVGAISVLSVKGANIPPPPGLEHVLAQHPSVFSAPPGLEHVLAERRQEERALQCEEACGLSADCRTVMLCNIPNKYTQEMLIARLFENGLGGKFDLVYLPVDFKSKKNVGYAFLNFRTHSGALEFHAMFHQKSSKEMLPGFNSLKVCEVKSAHASGLKPILKHLQGDAAGKQSAGKGAPMFFDEAGLASELPPESFCI